MEENLRPEEPLVANIYTEQLFGDGVATFILLKPLVGICVILGKLFGHVRTNIAEALLMIMRRKQRLVISLFLHITDDLMGI